MLSSYLPSHIKNKTMVDLNQSSYDIALEQRLNDGNDSSVLLFDNSQERMPIPHGLIGNVKRSLTRRNKSKANLL